MNKETTIKVCGKWILAGEYAVLKSYPALVFPLFSHFIELKYQREDINDLRVIENKDSLIGSSKQGTLASFFESVLDQALKNISKSLSDLKGIIRLNSQISLSAGMGASAVICILIGKLFYYLNWLKEEDLFCFCHALENSLHGQSSGVDIAAVLTGKPILYRLIGSDLEKPAQQLQDSSQRNITQRKALIEIFQPLWKPNIFLSHCRQSSSTKVNVEQVRLFWKKEPKKADDLNKQMAQAVLKAKEGLEEKNKEKGLALLKESFFLSEECFVKWNLVTTNMREHIMSLKKQGALAVKPTGSGSGGCVLSLWSELPPPHLRNRMTPAFCTSVI